MSKTKNIIIQICLQNCYESDSSQTAKTKIKNTIIKKTPQVGKKIVLHLYIIYKRRMCCLRKRRFGGAFGRSDTGEHELCIAREESGREDRAIKGRGEI